MSSSDLGSAPLIRSFLSPLKLDLYGSLRFNPNYMDEKADNQIGFENLKKKIFWSVRGDPLFSPS